MGPSRVYATLKSVWGPLGCMESLRVYGALKSQMVTICTLRTNIQKFFPFCKELYCTDSIYRVYKDKLQNCSSKIICINIYTVVQVELNNMYINIGANNGSEKLVSLPYFMV